MYKVYMVHVGISIQTFPELNRTKNHTKPKPTKLL